MMTLKDLTLFFRFNLPRTWISSLPIGTTTSTLSDEWSFMSKASKFDGEFNYFKSFKTFLASCLITSILAFC